MYVRTVYTLLYVQMYIHVLIFTHIPILYNIYMQHTHTHAHTHTHTRAHTHTRTRTHHTQLDPALRPVNLLESRNILPPTPITPPKIVLPAGLGGTNPKPEVMCCTMNALPTTSSLLGKLKLPLAIHIHPFKDVTGQVLMYIRTYVLLWVIKIRMPFLERR